jgi:myo-inositol-1-phosphate synthase
MRINVAIAGVGNFAKALVEGVAFYAKNPSEQAGLMNPVIGTYSVSDINFVSAFDVDERKVGKKLHKAISVEPNVAMKITEPLEYSAIVHRGPTLDGVIDEMKGTFVRESNAPVADIVKILKETKAEVLINFVPTGGEKATYAYAEAALQANCSFINCIPTPLATLPEWKKRFEEKGLVLLGDDIKSQLGATMLNRFLLTLLKMRGIRVTKSEQENRGGNADHFNLLYRAKAKEKSKREALTAFLAKDDSKPVVKFFYTGKPSGSKIVNLNIEGKIFGNVPIKINSVIEDEISINGAGVVVDAIRAAKFLVDRGKQKNADKICPFLMKSPPKPMSDSEAFEAFNEQIHS